MKVLGTTKAYLTPKQKSILLFLIDHLERFGFSPTQQEIAEALGMNRSLVLYHLNVLQRSGYLDRFGDKRRNLRVLRKI